MAVKPLWRNGCQAFMAQGCQAFLILLKNITDRAHGSFQNILIPNDNPLPNLMVGVCLVLALAVNLMFPIDFFLFCACG